MTLFFNGNWEMTGHDRNKKRWTCQKWKMTGQARHGKCLDMLKMEDFLKCFLIEYDYQGLNFQV
jgi:hypothetical protein